MTPIATLTMNPTIDLTWEVEDLTDTGKTRAEVRSVVAGGGGINVARGIARLGGSATTVHTFGGDTGRRLGRLLDGERFEHHGVEVDGETRQALVLMVTDADRSFHIVPPGPSLTEPDGQRCLDALVGAIESGAPVVLSGSLPDGLPQDFYSQTIRAVRATGARVVLDTSGPGLRAALGDGVWVLKPNRREAVHLAGRDVEGFDDLRAINQWLLDRGAAEIVVTTLGEHGALCSSADGHTEVRTPPLPGPARSDAGAGDSLVAALIHRLSAGDTPAEACAVGVAAAASSVLTPGTELFDPALVERLQTDVDIRDSGGS